MSSTELVRNEDLPTSVVRRPEGGLLESVMRAVENPQIDPARLREFLEIGKELQAIEAEKQYAAAMSALQAELPVISKKGLIPNKRLGTGIKYAKWDDIFKAVQPLLQKHGF